MAEQRFDLMAMPAPKAEKAQYDTYMEAPLTKTPEGFLRGRAIATNIGVFPYTQPDGTVRRELRLPSEVRDTASQDSLKGKPVTNEHPKGTLVNAENAKDLAVGSIGDDIRSDSYHVSVPITITDAKTVADIENGKVALSCGYTCDLEDKGGVWMGVNYDAIQRNIRYNHVAVVAKGRAGDAAKLRMDAADAGIYCDSDLMEGHMGTCKQEGGKWICTDGCKQKKHDHADDSHEVIVVDSGVRIDTVALGISHTPRIR